MNSSEILISKIAVVGPESTGKSTMAKYLADQFLQKQDVLIKSLS